MDFTWSEEQEALRETARALLTEHCGPEAVRRAMATEAGHDPELWKRIGQELGWTAIPVPEEHGGLGLGPVELAALLEVMGGFLPCAPFFSTLCLGAAALLEAGSEAQRAAWLPGIAAGELRATLAVAEAAGRWDAAGVATCARREGDEFVLDGAKRFVLDGHAADLLVIAARAHGTRGEEGVSLFVVRGDAPGLARRALPTLDATRRLAELRLEGVRLPADALLGAEGAGWRACARGRARARGSRSAPSSSAAPSAIRARVLDRARIALGAEQLGGAERCLELAVAHAGEREQFGRPIGSFQAVKHRCADMLVAVESARSAVYYAACAAAEGPDELPLLAPLVKTWCSEAYFRCAADCLQIHGGVGFTWEYDVHLHLKRARSMEAFLGAPADQRERIARGMGLGEPA